MVVTGREAENGETVISVDLALSLLLKLLQRCGAEDPVLK